MLGKLEKISSAEMLTLLVAWNNWNICALHCLNCVLLTRMCSIVNNSRVRHEPFHLMLPVAFYTHQALIACRFLHRNQLSGSVAAIGKLTNIKHLCVEQHHDDDLPRCLSPFRVRWVDVTYHGLVCFTRLIAVCRLAKPSAANIGEVVGVSSHKYIHIHRSTDALKR